MQRPCDSVPSSPRLSLVWANGYSSSLVAPPVLRGSDLATNLFGCGQRLLYEFRGSLGNRHAHGTMDFADGTLVGSHDVQHGGFGRWRGQLASGTARNGFCRYRGSLTTWRDSEHECWIPAQM